jgi:predicted NBD/HSP70 family sugar kinase
VTSAAPPARRPLRPSGKLRPEDARRHHRSLLLQLLFRYGPASRADLARSSGLTKVTVSDLVAELVEEGLVTEAAETVPGRIGKPPVLVSMAPASRAIVAVDLSTDGFVSGALVDLAGTVLTRRELPLENRRGQDAVEVVHRMVRTLLDEATRPVLGIGVGSPGVVDAGGTVLDAPNLGWTNNPLAADLRAAFDLPVFVANDANTAVLGEHTFGDTGDGGVMLLRVGTGVGAGLVLEGVLLHGHRSAAGEIGHVVVDPEGEACACGRRGCLETVLSVPALRRRLEDEDAATVLADVGERLGAVLAPVVGTLNLHELVLSGPAELLDGPLLEATDRTIRERTMPVSGDELVIRTSDLGEDGSDVVLVGAAVLVLAGQLGVS